MNPLTLEDLKAAASDFAQAMSGMEIPDLFGVTDGKAVGTYVERAFHDYLQARFDYRPGSSASGIDIPSLEVDLKVTSVRQPQSSCSFRSADQKVYGLGYHLLVFIYDKQDDSNTGTAHLEFQHVFFVDKKYTADYQTTRGILEILRQDGNKDDLVAFLEEHFLPLDETGRNRLAERILKEPPIQGYLTVSNALQWRLQYGRIISATQKGSLTGIERLLGSPEP